MSTVTWSCVSETRLLLSLVLVIMTSFSVTHSVILRPNWFPYFRDDQDAPHPANGSIAQNGAGGGEGGDSGSGSETHASEADLLRHLQLQRELNRHSAADLRSAMAYARAHNCTASQDGSTTPTSSCYYRYTTLLLRLLQRNFYDAVSP